MHLPILFRYSKFHVTTVLMSESASCLIGFRPCENNFRLSTKTFCHLRDSCQFGGGPICLKQLLIHYKKASVMVSGSECDVQQTDKQLSPLR